VVGDLVDRADPTELLRIMTVLVRTAVRHPEARQALWATLGEAPRLARIGPDVITALSQGLADEQFATDAGQRLLKLVEALPAGGIDWAEWEVALPHYSTALAELAATVTERALSQEVDPPRRARLLNNLANRLSDLGLRDEALVPAEGAVRLYRGLAAANPRAFTPELAGSLSNLANRLSGLGRRDEALGVAEEAVGLRRQLVAANPQAFTPDLAMSLSNLANRLSGLGRHEEALAVAEEAVDLYRELTATNPRAFAAKLATSLNRLASVLLKLGRREEALGEAAEAVAINRDLATANPQTFTPQLATSLNNLASFLLKLGRREEAVGIAEEAVALRRQLAPPTLRPSPPTSPCPSTTSPTASQILAAGRRPSGSPGRR
jgi:tetratricopeptide (TPR) repeat protein